MTTFARTLAALLAVLALGLLAAGCGNDEEQPAGSAASGGDDGAATTQPSGNLIQRDPANAGKSITVGSKNFAEQYVLGEIYAQALEAAGFDVTKELDLGAEQVAFKALKGGEIDLYPEYTGTALTAFYKLKTDDVPRDPDRSFADLQEKLAGDDIVAQPPTSFQNTYKVTSTKETAERFGNPKTLSELAERAGSDVTISGYPECRQRTDCLLGLERVYGWTPEFVSSQGQYDDLDKGQADFTFGFSTDGPLSLDKYVTYEDDKNLFPPYYVTALTRKEADERLGDAGREVIQAVQRPLTEEIMQELNARVTIDKQEPEQVARDYLREAGFIEG